MFLKKKPDISIMPVSKDILTFKRRLFFKTRHTYVAHCTLGKKIKCLIQCCRAATFLGGCSGSPRFRSRLGQIGSDQSRLKKGKKSAPAPQH